MKISIAQTTIDLNRFTFGFGAGYSYTFNQVDKPFLSTDTLHTLHLQGLSKNNFVVSTVVTIKLGKLKVDQDNKLVEDENHWKNRFAINLAINVMELNTAQATFNKSIDGGIGLGYFLAQNAQLSLFYDISRYRQINNYKKEKYLDKSIPDGKTNLNALDINNDDLFYTKTFGGLSFKLIISIGNKSENSINKLHQENANLQLQLENFKKN